MNRLSQLGNKQPTDNRHYTLKISGFIRFVVNLEKDELHYKFVCI